MRNNKELIWLCVDLDKTIAENTGFPDFKLLGPRPGARENLQKLSQEGWKIVIHTSRPSSDYEMIEEWLLLYDIPCRRIECGKVLGRFYLDDRNVPFGTWDEMYHFIQQHKNDEA